ncbi:MAG: S1 RNA-binding domain-containing protein [Ruminococcaceae bacterium]|nr:S1 RNA-binding domain-containing protein [Oscillospiraceae bacterium]
MSNEIGSILDGRVTSITKFGAFVALPDSKSGMIHISEISNSYVKDINEFIKVGQEVRVKVCSVDEKGRIALSLKQVEDKKEERTFDKKTVEERKTQQVDIAPKKTENDSFEDMMSRFLKTSSEKMTDLKKAVESKRGSSGFSRKNSKKY